MYHHLLLIFNVHIIYTKHRIDRHLFFSFFHIQFENPMYGDVHQHSGGGAAYMDPQEHIMSGGGFDTSDGSGYLDVNTNFNAQADDGSDEDV